MCENNEEGGKTSYRLKFLLQTKFSNKLVYRLQKCKLCVVPTPKSSGLTDLVVSVHNAIIKMMMVWHHPLRYGEVCWTVVTGTTISFKGSASWENTINN